MFATRFITTVTQSKWSLLFNQSNCIKYLKISIQELTVYTFKKEILKTNIFLSHYYFKTKRLLIYHSKQSLTC